MKHAPPCRRMPGTGKPSGLPGGMVRSLNSESELACRRLGSLNSDWEMACRSLGGADSDWEMTCRSLGGADSDWEMTGPSLGGADSDWEMVGRRLGGANSDWEMAGRRLGGADSDWEMAGRRLGGLNSDWEMTCRTLGGPNSDSEFTFRTFRGGHSFRVLASRSTLTQAQRSDFQSVGQAACLCSRLVGRLWQSPVVFGERRHAASDEASGGLRHTRPTQRCRSLSPGLPVFHRHAELG
jgi:hypothetical protein